MDAARRNWPKGFLQTQVRYCVVGALALAGCTLAITHVKETHYIAVPSADNVNCFRVRVDGWATLSKTKSGQAEAALGHAAAAHTPRYAPEASRYGYSFAG